LSHTKTAVATWGLISDQKDHSHCVSWCYIQLLRVEYIKKLEKMAIVPRLILLFCSYLKPAGVVCVPRR
jgi:hypothetical protein